MDMDTDDLGMHRVYAGWISGVYQRDRGALAAPGTARLQLRLRMFPWDTNAMR
jgi:hypothetical protein